MPARAPTPVSLPLKKWKNFLSAATTTQKLISDKTETLKLHYLKCFLSLKESRLLPVFLFYNYKNISKNKNLRLAYLASLSVGGQEEELYSDTDKQDFAEALEDAYFMDRPQ